VKDDNIIKKSFHFKRQYETIIPLSYTHQVPKLMTMSVIMLKTSRAAAEYIYSDPGPSRER
jgi:hypothetical protein